MAANKVVGQPSRLHYWGKIDEETDDLPQKESNKSEKLKNNWNSFEIPPVFQPSSSHKGPKKEVSKRNLLWMKPPLDSKGQSYLLQSIELQHYKRRMRYMLSAAHSHHTEMQKGNTFENPVLPSPPVPPKRFCSNEGRLISHNQASFLSSEYVVEGNKKGLERKCFNCPIQLDSLATRQLLLKSVAALTAHSGFEGATETSLSTLTDVVSEYCFKMCKMLKTYLEHQPRGETATDAFSHVMKQCTSQDIASLQEYWLTRVKQVALKLEKEDLQLLEQYNALKDSSVRAVVKEEKG